MQKKLKKKIEKLEKNFDGKGRLCSVNILHPECTLNFLIMNSSEKIKIALCCYAQTMVLPREKMKWPAKM